MAKRKSEYDKAVDRALRFMANNEKACPTLTKYSRNLTRLALEDKLDKVYHRDVEIINIQKVLLRKAKANVLLTGSAGCGKTAVVEGLAQTLATKLVHLCQELNRADVEYELDKRAYNEDPGSMEEPTLREVDEPYLSKAIIFDLNLTAMVGGTKYRGEFEERLNAVLDECKSHPNIILFIDEVHLLVDAGASDNNEGAAQMLKPAMARKDICVIGATTTDEAKMIWKDKALTRRFNEIKVLPLAGNAAYSTAEGILQDYAKYHEIETSVADVPQIMSLLETFLPHTVFPDNFINVVDETFAGMKFDGRPIVDMTHYKATISRMAGVVIV